MANGRFGEVEKIGPAQVIYQTPDRSSPSDLSLLGHRPELTTETRGPAGCSPVGLHSFSAAAAWGNNGTVWGRGGLPGR